MTALLDIERLSVRFGTRRGAVTAVEDVTLQVGRGEVLGIVGESGSGKSVTSYAAMRILDRAGRVAAGRVRFAGVDLLALPEAEMNDLRGREIAMIFQNPRAALNPIRRVGAQIADALLRHGQANRGEARARAVELLRTVQIAEPEHRVDAYPFQMSGGMCQRVCIAIALACRPRLLIADEPTTGLDTVTQKAVMDLIAALGRERDMATILITHDLGLASAYCTRIAVMQGGRVVEEGPTEAVLTRPTDPYTQRLLRATPRSGATLPDLLPPDAPRAGLAGGSKTAPVPTGASPLLTVTDLSIAYDGRRVVHDVSLTVHEGESVALVGESGSGKSTISAAIARLTDPASGAIRLRGRDIAAIPARRFARDPDRRAIQLVFQDATESLNPRHTASRAIADPLLRLAGATPAEARAEVERLADLVGLPRGLLGRFPHQLSGGQKARVGIARAIALRPALLVLDEPTAALDVSVQAVVLNLLASLQAELGMAYLFVSHDLRVVEMLCDRVIVLQRGRVLEQGPVGDVLGAPAHAYTRSLLEALPVAPGFA